MCGIVGIFDPQSSSENQKKKIKNCLSISHHRGPDENGVFTDEKNHITIGMNRLSILDIKNGQQPLFSQDGRYCIIFNGEIVNSEDLKIKLKKKGITFKTKNSDTEVLLYMLITFGESCLKDLNGMFAFCFYDLLKREIFLARDRFGIKPLYFFFKSNVFAFASELKTLTTLYENQLEINNQSFSDYLSLMYIPSPNTIFKNIFKLGAGEKINFGLDDKKIVIKKWHNHTFKIDENIDELYAKSQIQKLAKKAILRWTQSDVKICNSLSGGIDSSVISSLLGNQKFDLVNFSIGFSNKDDEIFDEMNLAKKVSNKWSQKHFIKKINPEEIINKIDFILESIHEPYGGGLPSWNVYEEISKNYKVTLNGTGIDEFFGNYGKWEKLDPLFGNEVSFQRFEKKFFNLRYYASSFEKQKILNFKLDNFESTSFKFFKIFQEYEGTIKDKSALLDIKTQLTDEFLQICDNFSMSHSLEARPAYLDNEFTDFLFTIPSSLRVGSKQNLKKMFVDSFRDILPNEIVNAKKRGFILPIENWLKGSLKPFLKKYLSSKKIDQHGLLNRNIYENIIEPFLNRTHFSSKFDKFHRQQTQVWSILIFQLWFEKNLNNKKIEI
jgi:asparagine synthase (glutamine-hydrolysing)